MKSKLTSRQLCLLIHRSDTEQLCYMFCWPLLRFQFSHSTAVYICKYSKYLFFIHLTRIWVCLLLLFAPINYACKKLAFSWCKVLLTLASPSWTEYLNILKAERNVWIFEYFIYQHRYYTVKNSKRRTVSTGQKGSKSTYSCPKRKKHSALEQSVKHCRHSSLQCNQI